MHTRFYVAYLKKGHRERNVSVCPLVNKRGSELNSALCCDIIEAPVGGVVGKGEWICWRRSRLEHPQRQELMLELALGHSTNRCWRMWYMATEKFYAPYSCTALFSWSKEEKENTTKTKHDKNKTKQYRKDHHRVILDNSGSSELVGREAGLLHVLCALCADKGKTEKCFA